MKKCVLGDLMEVTRGASLAGKYYATSGEKVRLTLANFDYSNNCFKADTSKDNIYYTQEVENRFLLQEGDIITPLTEQTPGLLGTTARIPESGKYIQSQDVALLRPFEDKLDPDFCFYLVSSKSVREQLGAMSQQTKIRHSSPDKIKGCTVFLPDIVEQKKIGRFLSTIDRKIALNRKRIATLEAMAKEIYDYWFVQFDFPDAHGRPYKSSGGAMIYNPDLKREIPKGWEVGVLPDIVEFTNGLACQRFRPRSGERSLPVLKIKEMHDGITDQTERVKEDIPERFKVYDGDIIFSWSASLEVMVWFYGKAGLNQHIFKVTEKDGWPIHFSYFLLSDYVAIFRRIAESRKTTMGHITSDHLRVSTVPLPQHKVVAEKFEEIVRPIFDALVNAAHEVSNLVNMRDTLLPLLMNGQVKVG